MEAKKLAKGITLEKLDIRFGRAALAENSHQNATIFGRQRSGSGSLVGALLLAAHSSIFVSSSWC